MKRALFVAVFLTSFPVLAQGPKGYYRFPDLHGDTIVFTAEGDLWTVSRQGGVARRLTSHAGEESHPRISPDGDTVAFSATYEGPTELYTMPLSGGLPTRRTFEAQDSIAIGWTPQGRVIYSTMEYSTLPEPQMVTLDLETGKRDLIPLTPASDGSYDSSGRTLYFASPAFHRNNTKRYRGGTARNIWKFSRGDGEAVNLTADFAGENHSPMWWKDRVYYVCDRDGTMNIWSMNTRGGGLRQETHHSGWDVLSPSLSAGRIVYQLGADIHLLDLESKHTRALDVRLASDLDQLREKWIQKPMRYLTAAHLDPAGRRVALTSRGRVFVAPAAEQGRLVRVSQKEGVRYRDAVFMPEGKTLLALSDESGEVEFQILPADGAGKTNALTRDGYILRFGGHPSPDGRWVVYWDKNRDLWLLDIQSSTQKKISANREGISDVAWSADSHWIAYTMSAVNSYRQIHLFHLDDGKTTALTSDRVNSFSPAWSPDGRFLYFLSDRYLRSLVGSPWGPRQPEPFFDKTIKIYLISLRQGLRSPFKAADELSPVPESPRENEDPKQASFTIDLRGIQRRLKEIPVAAGNYGSLSSNGRALFWIAAGRGFNLGSRLMALKFGNHDPKPVVIAEKIRSYELSADGKKLLLRKNQALYVLEATPKEIANLEKSKVDLSHWRFSIEVRRDFRQMFVDAWRLERDYFYDPHMHGVDWNAMKDKYLPLVDRVTTRRELSDLIGQLVGELSTLHVSVRGGDLRKGRDQISIPTLGARLRRDEAAGGYRIDYIYRSDPDYPNELSPLDDPDLGIEVGDIIESINGVAALSVKNPRQLLRNQQDNPVLLEIKSPNSPNRKVLVTPTTQSRNLRYRDWEYTRRLAVEQEGEGEIGYVHLKAMGAGNLTEWYRNYYPIFNRKGLIIDVRHNRGGNIDSMILSKLMRRAWFYWKPRVGQTSWNMQYAFRGPMVVLCDEMTASDGEAFSEGFRRLGLGKIIGTRTWGGEIWLSNNNRLSDGGLARAPQMGVYGPEGKWLIENHGVDPDIVVHNPPHAKFKGDDAQLEAAIAYLKKEIRRRPPVDFAPPPYPNKSFRYPPEKP